MDKETQSVSTVTPGLKWDDLNLSITLGRGKSKVKKPILNVYPSYLYAEAMIGYIY